MKNTEKETFEIITPEHDWQNPETDTKISIEDQEEYSFFGDYEDDGTILQASANSKQPDPEDEEEDEDEEEKEEDDDDDDQGDWGHVDPAESNNPFYDPNAPSAPGSAV